MFRPPFCPHRSCSAHTHPGPQFYRHRGSYRAKCRSSRVPRYQCLTCERTFSRQTFRMDYCDKKPHLNARLFELLICGVGLRQSARMLKLSRRCTELKFRKIARHIRRLNLNLRKPLMGSARFHFDEFETYEGQRNTRPLTVPVLVESETRFIVWAESAPIRPHGKMTEKRRKLIARAEKRYGKRRNGSKHAVRRTLRRGASLVASAPTVTLESDEKSTYRPLAKQAFGEERLRHNRTSSKLARTPWNPLFTINHEETIMRELMARVRRDSWLTSKKRRFLDLGLQLHMAYRNLVRLRFNKDSQSPAQRLGFAPRRLEISELLTWRQECGPRSPHPLTRSGTSVSCWNARAAAAG
jgi:transposase-like protein